jgi:hypothetical protein
MSNFYKNPDLELVDSGAPDFIYQSLGIWRKIFLVINWLGAILFSVALIFVAINEEDKSVDLGISALIVLLLTLAYAYWLHVAVATRNVTQLLIIALLNIIPFLNPVSAILVFAIRSTSKSERGL